MDLGTIKYRLRSDFQLAVMTMLGGITVLGVSPFTVLRALNAQWFEFSLDIAIQSGILIAVFFAWRTGETRRPSLFLAYFIGIMAAIVGRFLPGTGEYWFFPAIVANFFLVDRRPALAIAAMALIGAIAGNARFGASIYTLSFAFSTMVCALLSYAFSYRTAMQREQLEDLASKDPLTSLFNRRTLLDELGRAHELLERDRRACGILILDLDHFKDINDRYGHLTGDHVLIHLAGLLAQNVRKGDRVFRYGGEEFVVLTMPTDRAGVERMAENLRAIIELNLDDAHGHAITASIGGAVLRMGETVEDWFARADMAMYEAKSEGRNRVVVAPES